MKRRGEASSLAIVFQNNGEIILVNMRMLDWFENEIICVYVFTR